MNKPLNVDAPARVYYEALAEDFKLCYPRLPMPAWDNAGEEIQEVAREIARARVHQVHGRVTGSARARSATSARMRLECTLSRAPSTFSPEGEFLAAQ
jgi:hypothetical protein